MILWPNLNPTLPTMKLTFATYLQRCGVASGYFFAVCVALVLASIYLRGAERKYTVSMTFKPVIEDSSGPNFGWFWRLGVFGRGVSTSERQR